VFKEFFLARPPLSTDVKIMLAIWCLILVPWLPFITLMGSGLAFDGGNDLGAYLFVLIAWAYPTLVLIAYFFRRKKPGFIWLPILPLIVLIIAVIASIFSG
jgi:hypothetical protein